MYMLCCLELYWKPYYWAALSQEECCRFPTGPNETAFSLWENDLCFFISPKLEAILIFQSLHFTDLDSDCHAYCWGEKKRKKNSHVYFWGDNTQMYCTESLSAKEEVKQEGSSTDVKDLINGYIVGFSEQDNYHCLHCSHLSQQMEQYQWSQKLCLRNLPQISSVSVKKW